MSTSADVLCAGIVVADHVCSPVSHLPKPGELVLASHFLLTIGGCAANVAVDLVRMGNRASVVGKVGSDAFGRIVTDLLLEQSVAVTWLQVCQGTDTSQTMIVNVKGEDRRFIHSFGANAEFTAADIPMISVRQCRVLYLGGYLVLPRVAQDELRNVFAEARRAGAKTVLDVVIPGPGDHMAQLERLLPEVDVFLPNSHEGEAITGERDPLRQAETFHRLGAATAIITQGADGAVLVQEGKRLRAGAYSVPVVDGSGGGDAFAAGYIHGLLHGMETEDCLRVASALGASCVREIGTTTGVFSRIECESFLHENPLTIEEI